MSLFTGKTPTNVNEQSCGGGVFRIQINCTFAGLIIGIACITGGVILFLNVIIDSDTRTADVLSAPRSVPDAALGSIILIAGLFLIYLALSKMKPKANADTNELRDTLVRSCEKPADAIERIVARALQDATKFRWSSFSFFTKDEIDKDGITAFRMHFEPYFEELIAMIGEIRKVDAEPVSRLLNDFFVGTALNQALDAWYASFLIHDLAMELLESIRAKGGDIYKVSSYLDYLQLSWKKTSSTEAAPVMDRRGKFALQVLLIHGELVHKA